MAAAPEPLWQALRAALEERGYSVRGFAKACYEADDRMTRDSWLRTIRRAVQVDTTYTPSRETAELWSRLLKKPKAHFVRPPLRTTKLQRVTAERDEALAEVDRLRRELARRQARSRRA